MSRAGKIATSVAIVVALGLAAGWFGWVVPTRKAVDIGAGLLAKQVCSCVYLAQRDAADCRADETALLDPIQLEILPDVNRVHAWILGLADRTAIYREGFGCMLE
jgi:hypothetical protein